MGKLLMGLAIGIVLGHIIIWGVLRIMLFFEKQISKVKTQMGKTKKEGKFNSSLGVRELN